MRRDYLILAGMGLLFFLPFLGNVHLFDWDEINFAECAREMLITGDWLQPQIDFEPFWEKPPLFFWMQALSMKLFGVSEFAARFPNVLAGLATILVVYKIGTSLHGRVFGWIWAMGWVASLLPHLYFRSGIIDPWFNLFTFVGLYGFIEFRWRFFTHHPDMSFLKKYRFLALGGGVLGLAVLTKGPAAYLIAMLVIVLYWARYKFRGKGYFLHFVILSAHALLAALLWFGVETFMNGTWFVTEFIQYQIRLFATPDSGHGGFLGYHFVVLLFGCFPFSVLALPNLRGMKDDSEDELLESDTLTSCKRSDFVTWMQLLFWVVLILFSVVKTKILHYSSLAYFPLTYLGALTLWRAIRWGVYPRIVSFMLIPVGFLLGTLVAAIPLAGMSIDVIRPLFSKDPFALGNLEASVAWSFTDMIPGLILIAASLGAGVFWIRKNAWQAGQVLLAGGAVFTSFTLVLLVPNIEGYSQRAAIEFYESHCGEKCFIKPVGFKSYAHLFYSCKQDPGADKRADDYDRLTFGTPDRNVYFVAKVERLGELPGIPGCHEIGRRNGFVFFERHPEPSTPSSHD